MLSGSKVATPEQQTLEYITGCVKAVESMGKSNLMTINLIIALAR